jgi:CMP-N,N'-diacetyllegionaminic acid synthase
MIDGKRVLALIPARAGSKGLPGKNIRPLNGKPLLAWPIEAALNCDLVDEVVVSTDSEEFAEISRKFGARVPFLRPEHLASDHASSIMVIRHAIDCLEEMGEHFDLLVLLEPTSPLTEAEDIEAAIRKLSAALPTAEALVGVTAMITNHPAYAVTLKDGDLIAPYQSSSFGQLPRRQDLEPIYCLDGSLYISTIEALRREEGFCHESTIAYETARHKAFEVDDLVDFICIEAISSNIELIKTES